MFIEQSFIEWSGSRPLWQQIIMKRVALGEVLTEQDYDQLFDALFAGRSIVGSSLDLNDLPHEVKGELPVSFISITDPEHLNALETDKPLEFAASGLTIVYGDNATGKSGYARVLKDLTRARHHENILSDVFQDGASAAPGATILVRIGEEEKVLKWPGPRISDLQRALFYDQLCGVAYIATETDFPYRPPALSVLDGLIKACVAIRNRADFALLENASRTQTLPLVVEEAEGTPLGQYLIRISGDSSVASLDNL